MPVGELKLLNSSQQFANRQVETLGENIERVEARLFYALFEIAKEFVIQPGMPSQINVHFFSFRSVPSLLSNLRVAAAVFVAVVARLASQYPAA